MPSNAYDLITCHFQRSFSVNNTLLSNNVSELYCVLCRMAVDVGCGETGDWEGRWNHVKKFLERSGPFIHPAFEPSNEVRNHMFTYFFLSIALHSS